MISSLFQRLLTASKAIFLETWIFLGIFLLTRFSSNKLYFLLLLFSIILIYKVSKNLLHSLWFVYLATFPYVKALPLKLVQLVGDLNFQGNTFVTFGDIILFFIVYIIISRRKKYHIKLDGFDLYASLFLTIFFAIAAISIFYAQYTITSLYYLYWLTKLIVIYFCAKTIFSNPNTFRKTLQIIKLFVLLNSVLVIGQYLLRGPIGLPFEDTFNQYGKYSEQNLFRPGGITTDPNISASLTTALIPLVFLETFTINSSSSFGWVLFLIYILALTFTASRAAWTITFAVSLAMAIYLYKKGKFFVPASIKKYWKIALIVLIVATIPILVTRISSFQQAFTWKGSGTYRFRQISLGLTMMKRNLFGVGLGMFSHSVSSYNLPEISQLPSDLPHNVFIQIGAETGIFGLAAFSFFVYFLFRSKLVNAKKDDTLFSKAVFVSFISIVLLMLVYPWFMHPRIAWLFWLFSAYQKKV